MKAVLAIVYVAAAVSLAACSGPASETGWLVEKMDIPLYHSSWMDAETGAIAHIEYRGAKLTRGSESLLVVYRPIDYPERDPGFAAGDTVIVEGLDTAKDHEAVDGPDYWIDDIKIFNPKRMRGF